MKKTPVCITALAILTTAPIANAQNNSAEEILKKYMALNIDSSKSYVVFKEKTYPDPKQVMIGFKLRLSPDNTCQLRAYNHNVIDVPFTNAKTWKTSSPYCTVHLGNDFDYCMKESEQGDGTLKDVGGIAHKKEWIFWLNGRNIKDSDLTTQIFCKIGDN